MMNIRVFVSMSRQEITHYIKHQELDPVENNQLIFDFGMFSLVDKKIFIEIKPRGYKTEVYPTHGLVFLPVKEMMLKEGFNYIQATFEDIHGNIEKSPIIEWKVQKKSPQNAI